ncbi:MAG: hypothetical protein ABSD62_10405 [Candidatus Limnocylindrales bacterium]|jgi:hypothetical protein
MRRFGAGLAALVLLMGLLPFTLSSCYIACGCATPPDQNQTPPPIQAEDAATSAAKLAGVPAMTADLTGGAGGRLFYRATAANTVAFVDAISGIVVEVVLEDRLPDNATVSATTAGASTAAETFMQRTGLDTASLTESARLTRQAGVAAYDVEWKESGGGGATRFAVSVNASTGSVFAYVDLRMQLSVTAPIVGQARATELAIAALSVPGEQVTSAELAIDFATGAQASAWEVGLGVPSPTQADVFEHGALVRVDAVTGEATIVKS